MARVGVVSASTTTAPAVPVAAGARRAAGTRVVCLAGLYYLVAAVIVTIWLWRDPASRIVAANPYDSDQFTWFFRYDASAVAHLRLPALTTIGMKRPAGHQPDVEHADAAARGGAGAADAGRRAAG